jgi:carbamoyl-phosphate synthase small subunit
MTTATLLLADGRRLHGEGFGAQGVSFGEVVFNTAMWGYQEILTDPSYRRQIVTLTSAEIGNYGCVPRDDESGYPQVSGLVIRALSPLASNFRADEDLDHYLRRHGIVGIRGIDTRALTRSLRDHGAIPGAVCYGDDLDLDAIAEELAQQPLMAGSDLASEVTTQEVYEWGVNSVGDDLTGQGSYHVVAYDFGVKRNILRLLKDHDARVTVVPASTGVDVVKGLQPDGVFLSNGPGDPAAVDYVLPVVRDLMASYPTFGICLGHQLMALSQGASTFKMKFGHRGGNHPVQHFAANRVEITSQNHGFAVSDDALPEHLKVTHRHLNDETIAGLSYEGFRAFSVQFHPEAAPGPHDSRSLFRQFHQQILSE